MNESKGSNPDPRVGINENRMIAAGGLTFAVATLLQMLQLSSLSIALSVAIAAAAIAIPFFASTLISLLNIEAFPVKMYTPSLHFLISIGTCATFICAAAIFCHFSVWLGGLFVGASAIGFIMFVRVYAEHQRMHSGGVPRPRR